MKLHLVEDGVPRETIALLTAAAARRGVATVVHDGRTRRPDGAPPETACAPGDLLYKPGISYACTRLEQQLWVPGVATFHGDPDGPFFPCANAQLRFEQAGLPVPRSVEVAGLAHADLPDLIEHLGGLPVVVKVPGSSRGIGVMRADSLGALRSLVDFLQANHPFARVMAMVAPAVHWRVVVVGDRAVAGYVNPVDDGDFRTSGTSDPGEVTADVPPELAEVAIAAVQVQRLELGGVDLLVHESGRVYLLESNFPLYHAHAETVGGVPVSQAMVDHLIDKAVRLGAAAPVAPAALPPPSTLGEALCERPRLRQLVDWRGADECAALAALARPEALDSAGIEWARDRTGLHAELPLAHDARLADIAAGMAQVVGVDNALGTTLRLRRYAPGDGHPLHGDQYVIDGHRLVATALLYLETPEAGGETRFPNARPAPVDVAPRAGTLVWWFNYLDDGSPDTHADHQSVDVQRGHKTVLAQFFYRAG
jgi:hypothetical protein